MTTPIAARTPEQWADLAYQRMCADPEVWLTHGLPSGNKEARILRHMADTISAALQQRALDSPVPDETERLWSTIQDAARE